MSDPTDWINERRNIHNAATEGPWGVVDEQELVGAKDGWPEYLLEGVAEGCEGFVRDCRDATAIVDAHNTLPNLLTAVEKVLALCDQWDREASNAIPGVTGVTVESDEAFKIRLLIQSAIEGAIK